jgi:hypothetical protein
MPHTETANQLAGDRHYLRWKQIEVDLQRAHAVKLRLEPRFTPGFVELWSIDSKDPGSGAGSDAMRELVGLADQANTALTLLVDAGQNEGRLIKWYSSFGFVSLGEGAMERKPGAAVTRPAQRLALRAPLEMSSVIRDNSAATTPRDRRTG